MVTPIDTPENALIKRTTLTELCAAWAQSEAQIKQAFKDITEAQERLTAFFDGGYRNFTVESHRQSVDFAKPEPSIKNLQKQVWAALIERLELRKILSLKRISEMDKQIETGEGLPEITLQNVQAILESNLNNAGQFLQEKVIECYEMLRPCGWSLSDYKTNQKSAAAGVGHKVIMTWAVRRSYGGGFEVSYGRHRDELRALDQVFHLLDGAAQSRDYNGPLVDAISKQTTSDKNTFETVYFRGRCFQNQNLHLEFKRADLVDRFNAIAGGMRINGQKP